MLAAAIDEPCDGLDGVLVTRIGRFEPFKGATLARDVVRYAVPFDWLLHRWFVRPDIERIFAFRAAALQKRFGAASRVDDE